MPRLLRSLWLGGFAAAVLAPPLAAQYIPPPRGAPGGRVGGATRSAAVPAGELPAVELLAPADQAGLTAKPAPTLYYFLSRPSRWPLDLAIAAPGQPAPLLDVAIPAPTAAGIYPVSLGRLGVRLQPGIDYTWSVSVVIDPHAWSHNVVATAAIVFDPNMAASIADVPKANAADLARAGLWYDAVAAAADAPARAGRPALDALLRQVGLEAVAAADQRTAATP